MKYKCCAYNMLMRGGGLLLAALALTMTVTSISLHAVMMPLY